MSVGFLLSFCFVGGFSANDVQDSLTRVAVDLHYIHKDKRGQHTWVKLSVSVGKRVKNSCSTMWYKNIRWNQK